MVMALVANKSDLEPKREVETEVTFTSSSHPSLLFFIGVEKCTLLLYKL